ncbi:hypothetical protein AVEN_76297-1, partial [Araneus ventricosus]
MIGWYFYKASMRAVVAICDFQSSPFGQFVFNYTHPRKPKCSIAFGHIARWSDELSEA